MLERGSADLEDHFAVRLALLVQVQRLPRLIERKDGRDVRLDDSLLHQTGDLPQVLDVVFHAEIDGPHARLVRRFLIDLADQGDEHPAALEHAPRARLVVSAQRVEHHVDVAQLLLEALALVVDDGIDPDRFRKAKLGSLAVALTSAPFQRANCAANEPTPPLAPWMRKRIPGLALAVSMIACQAVIADIGSAAATLKSSERGFFTRSFTGTSAYSAKLPNTSPKTSSPSRIQVL